MGTQTSNKLASLLAAVELLRELEPNMEAQVMAALLHIMLKPDITMSELAEKTGASQSAASRHVATLSPVRALNKPGFGLVESYDDPSDRRVKRVNLTKKGERLAEQLADVL